MVILNAAEQQFLTELALGTGPTDGELLLERLDLLERERKILRKALRQLLATTYPEPVRQLAMTALTEASTPPDLGLRENNDTALIASCHTKKKPGAISRKITTKNIPVVLRRHSFRDNPALDASCRITPEQIEARARDQLLEDTRYGTRYVGEEPMRSKPCPECKGLGSVDVERGNASATCTVCNGACYVPA